MKLSHVFMVMTAVILAPHLQWFLAIPLAFYWLLLSYCVARRGD